MLRTPFAALCVALGLFVFGCVPESFPARPDGGRGDASALDIPALDIPALDIPPVPIDRANQPDVGVDFSEVPCPTGRTRCGAECVDSSRDPSHCGLCGVVCPSGQFCVAGRCRVDCDPPRSICGTGDRMSCVDLQSSNAHCGTCGTVCPQGQSCMAGRCRIACAAPRTLCTVGENMACADLDADTDHCGRCETVCPLGQLCTSGRCACAGGLTQCGMACADLTTSAAHCGACNRACPMGQRCEAGRCVLPCDSPTVSCPSGGAGGGEPSCVDVVTDNSHCGRCGNACPFGRSCRGGACACPTGLRECGGVCVDGSTSREHCGTCGNTCPAGQFCASGTCATVCDAPRVRCTVSGSEVCTNPQTDNSHCGSCNNACPAGRVCAAGSCVCAMGTTLCAGQCVDTRTSELHCGACGVVCPGAQQCVAGACVLPCAAPRAVCGAGAQMNCVDRQINSNHCGQCGVVCGGGQSCSQGLCVCPITQQLCNGRCVALDTDAAHCGTCGRACPAGQSCRAGACGNPAPMTFTYVDTGRLVVTPTRGTGTRMFAQRCPPGEVLIGLEGSAIDRNGPAIGQVRGICGRVGITGDSNPWRATVTRSTTLSIQGGLGGTPFSVICPADRIVVGIEVSSDTMVRRLNLRCGLSNHTARNAEGTVAGTVTVTGVNAGAPGTASSSDCPVNAFGVELGGISDAGVEGLRLGCAPLVSVGLILAGRVPLNDSVGGAPPPQGMLEEVCDAGQVLVGVDVSYAAGITGLGLRCAPMTGLSSPEARLQLGTPVRRTLRGGTGMFTDVSLCGANAIGVGTFGRFVMNPFPYRSPSALGVACATHRTQQSMLVREQTQPAAAIGSSGTGSAADQFCPGGTMMIGLRITFGGFGVANWAPICGAFQFR